MNQKVATRLRTLALRALHEHDPELFCSLTAIATCIEQGKVKELARALQHFTSTTVQQGGDTTDLLPFSRN